MADDKTEYLIKDRLSFQRFLVLQLCDTVPDAKTIWHFREMLNSSNKLDAVFNKFVNELEQKGIVTRSGSILDATFVDVPRQRNTKKENQEIKEGKTPEEWEKEENRNKKAQKDVDARWAVKNKEKHYGYKNHIKIDKKSKIITKYRTASAEVHDSQELENLIDEKDKVIYGDSAYTGEEVQSCIPETIQNRIHEKGCRNKPLTKIQERNNTAKSRIRVRVEHVFAAINHFGGIFIRTIGIRRAEFQIGMMNLAYNMARYSYLMGAKA
jgi:IS5 family transposase